MLYRKIDLDGNYVEEVSEIEETEEFQFISEPVPVGLYLPKWNGSEWIEGRSLEWIEDYLNRPEPLSPEQEEINLLKAQVQFSDDRADFQEEVITEIILTLFES